jgi:hypothetical protein
MMDSERATYLRTIEDVFVSLRGKGVMLSPRDVALVDGWRERGLPLRVVLSALQESAKRFVERRRGDESFPNTLAYFENAIEQAALGWRERSQSWSPQSADGALGTVQKASQQSRIVESLLENIITGRDATSEAFVQDILMHAWETLSEARKCDDIDVWALTAEVDADMVRKLESALSSNEQDALRRQAKTVMEAAWRNLSERARLEQQQREVERLIRDRYNLPDLVEVLRAQEL